MEQKGMDVSTFQGEIDWEKVKAAGIEFAMVRAGFGKDAGQTDAQFARNMAGAAKAGVPVGAYWFSYALSPEAAREEARTALEMIKPYKLAYPVAYDYEYDTVRYAEENGVSVTRELATACCKAFCEELEAAGYLPMVYTSLDFLRRYVDAEEIGRDVWLAQYNETPTYEGEIGMWQHTSTGRVDGVAGNVDLDVCYKDYPAMIQAAGLNGWGKPEEPEPAGIRAGDRVAYAGRLYGDSYGGSPGKTVDGVYTVDRVIEGRAYGVHTAGGWLETAKCRKAAVPTPEEPSKPTLKVGCKVHYSGRLYATSTGGGAGKTVDGTYTVSRYLKDKSHGVLLNGGLGWVKPGDCEVAG